MKKLIEPVLWVVVLIGVAHLLNAIHNAASIPSTPFAAVAKLLELGVK